MAEAAGLQSVLLRALRGSDIAPETAARDWHRMGVLLFGLRDFNGAAAHFRQAARLDPTHPVARLNEGLSLIRVPRMDEALAALTEAEARHPDDCNLHDGLAEAHGMLGNWADCRRHGERSLTLKDQAVRAAPWPDLLTLAAQPAPAPTRRDVIAFSLFGARERYLDGALRNARVAPYVYPGWRCRFYCDDSVPDDTRRALADEGAEVVMMPRPERWSDGLFWRFRVAEDSGVHRFLVRDCDAVLNLRERIAVAEWIDSGRPFHLMRDHPAHTDLILAGMWGGIAGMLPPLARLAEGFSYQPATESRNADQLFLGRRVWPLIRTQCLIHDRVYRTFDARPFPRGFDLPEGQHVGQNDHAARVTGKLAGGC